ncbi:MAG: MerR family transcriptional regulator [Paracoccaceae bacterium]
MDKSPDAFRTISEVADWLGTPTHVLRFWESRFTQVKPVKRAGGRRYYRPKDMELLGGIKQLLHDDGMTIRGVQKLLRKEGVKHVSSLSMPVETTGVIQATASSAAIELNASPEPIKNVVPIKDTSRIQARAGKSEEPETGPERAQSDTTTEAKAPLVSDIPDDPVEDDGTPLAITGVAAALRRAASSNRTKPRAEPKLYSDLYNRLVRLKKSMDKAPSP